MLFVISGLFDGFHLNEIDPSRHSIFSYHQKTCSCNNADDCIKFYRRYRRNGHVYHSIHYYKRKNSLSYFVEYRFNRRRSNFGDIICYFAQEKQEFAIVRRFIHHQRYSDYCRNSFYFDLIQKPINHFFFVLKQTDELHVIPVTDILNHSLRFENFRDSSTIVATPVV